ncbi:glycosyltransferase [Maridesulfovibrio sp.]|uniref:glycosyltransferase n=1 Tax=Maridesulfovibrio sp. TaxID=2795000 RepID=UPI0037495FBD
MSCQRRPDEACGRCCCRAERLMHQTDHPYEQNRGKGAALNKAFETSKGDYIAYLDDDDVWYENHIERLIGCCQAFESGFRIFQWN